MVDPNINFTPDDVIIYFVDEDEEDSSAFLRKINIDDEGMLSYWPEGVFNENYELLTEIKKKAFKNKSNK